MLLERATWQKQTNQPTKHTNSKQLQAGSESRGQPLRGQEGKEERETGGGVGDLIS